ncbi:MULTISPECIES: hypothetical protein [Shewanella]|uniref:hypothetical protein n=1 Tax=Shewanella TaxID=22 RepID=UPI001C66101D|nr:hypothetical protein [Shewanella sp. FJAT-51649]QYJ70951.1 hypothetical protein K0H59_18320 [Shewanella sp. FJAT-51649]
MQVNEEQGNTDNSDLDNTVFDAIKSINSNKLINECDRFLELLNTQYNKCDADSREVHFIGTVDELDEDELAKVLPFTNYTSGSLVGERVILFRSPLFVSVIRTSKIPNDRKMGDAIRLISHAGIDKKVSGNPKSFQFTGEQPYSSFEVYSVIFGFILPKSINFRFAIYLNFKELFEDRELLESLADSRERLKKTAFEYKKIAENSVRITSEGVKARANEYNEIKASISIQLDERARLADSLNENMVIRDRLEREIATANSKLSTIEQKLKNSQETTDNFNRDLIEIKSELDISKDELKGITSKIEVEQANLEKRQAMVRKTQSEMDSYSLDMNGFSKASRMHIWFCYAVMAALLSTLTNIFFMIYSNANDLIKFIDSTSNETSTFSYAVNKTSVLDILLSRLPAITATTLIIATLSTLLFFLVKHIIALHTDKMNMLKASILTEQVTYSLDCDGMKDSDIKELKRKSKIELLVKIFGLNGASSSSSDAIDSNKQIDLIAKVVETLKLKS